LVEDNHKGKWRGRTPQNKLVFFEAEGDWRGKLVDLEVIYTSPFSMQGRLPGSTAQPKLDDPILVFAD
jgi:tRNA-2-methylthio-N6-dimethylallyladenosine synthase